MNKQSAINIYKQAAKEGGLTLERQAQLKIKLLGSLDNFANEPMDQLVEPMGRKVFPRYVMVPILLVVLLFAGTVGAAQVALPGDGLYSLKRWTEKVEASWVVSDEGSAKTYARQANIRLDELEQLTLKKSDVSSDGASRFTAREELSRQEAQVALETALNRLNTIKLQLEEKRNEKAVEALSEIQAKLETRAGQHDYFIEVENETGRVRVGPKDIKDSTTKSERGRMEVEKNDDRLLENETEPAESEMELELDAVRNSAGER